MATTAVVKSLVTPHDQTLRKVFNAQRSYYIDIYQREYKWTEENVKTLLQDIELQFLQHDLQKKTPQDIQEDVLQRFEPYFMNTYLTHTEASHTSIVDGQQRLTTFLLIFIKLYRMLRKNEASTNAHKTFSSKVLEQLIFETNDFGDAERFKIFNENREAAFRALVDGQEIDLKDQTRKRIKENFDFIDRYLDRFLTAGRDGEYDWIRATYYIAYLLDRISIVEIHIERQDHVAMIFEVVNDRGLGLKPYEILKGKLIGGLPPVQKEKANQLWTELQEQYFAAQLRNTTEKTIDLDFFFRTFFRAKFADSENDYERFEGDYHYEIYRNQKIRNFFGDFHNQDILYRRIAEDFRYFAGLYFKLRTSYEDEYLIYNKLLDQNQQYLLLISNIRQKDADEQGKVRLLARKFDQVHVVLRLLDAYDSNQFQRLIYPLNVAIREKAIDAALKEFDQILIGALEDAGRISVGQHSQASELFEFERFKSVSNQWTNFSKYVLMRIDRYLAELLGMPSFAAGGLKELEERFNRSGMKTYAMHLEHIYTQHPKNKALFTKDGVFDESAFQTTRNLLGMVLLLKDKINLSSNDEVYSDKCDTYSKSGLIWNEMLVGHMHSTYLSALPAELRLEKIEPDCNSVFPVVEVASRQRAVFSAIRAIWGGF